MKYTRKEFLRLIGAGSIVMGTPAISCATTPNSSQPNEGLTLGLASYSLRKLSLDDALAMSNRLGLKHLALKSMHLPMDSSLEVIKATAEKVKAAGIDLYGAGVVYMKSEAEVRNAFAYAKTAGMRVIIGVPNPELLPLVEEQVKATDIKLAIHNHGPGDDIYPSPDDVYEKVKNMDKRMGLCIDIGHTFRIGEDPVEKAKKYKDRLYDIHLKDVDVASAKGRSVELGRGVMDIPAFLRAMKEINYQGIIGLEYEKDGDDPLAGLAESVGYARGVMDSI